MKSYKDSSEQIPLENVEVLELENDSKLRTDTKDIVPTGWAIVLLEQLAKRGSGHTPKKEVDTFYNGGIKWVSLADSDKLDNRLISSTKIQISEEGIKNSSAVLHPAGTVLLSRDAGVGKSAIMAEPMAVSQHFITWQCGPTLNNWYLYYYLQRQKPEFERIAIGSTIKTIGLPYFKKFKILLPPLPEQRAIASILSTWDKGIGKLKQLISAEQKRKKVLMQQLLTGKKRFKEFVETNDITLTKYGPYPKDWGYVPLSNVAKEVSIKNKEAEALPVLSCTKYRGLVDSLEYFGKQIFSKDTSTYKVVERGQFAYATNHIEEGSIGYQSKYNKALISPMYTAFVTTSKINDDFLYKLLKTDLYIHIYQTSTSASVDRRGSLRWKEFSTIKVPLPSIDEQNKISAVLQTADKEIDTLKEKLNTLTQQKRGLMQKLLTGQVRVKLRS